MKKKQKAPKTFLKIARLNGLSVGTNVGPIVRFWYHRYELEFFVAPCNEVAKYFYMGAHLQYMGLNAVHPFSQILKIFSDIPARIVAPPM